VSHKNENHVDDIVKSEPTAGKLLQTQSIVVLLVASAAERMMNGLKIHCWKNTLSGSLFTLKRQQVGQSRPKSPQHHTRFFPLFSLVFFPALLSFSVA
jgi:hypothetical protein